MFRQDSNYKASSKNVNCVLMDGGVGDHVASLVALNYMLKTYPWIKFRIWVPDFLLEFSKHLLPGSARVKSYKDMRLEYNPDLATKTTHWDGHVSPMKTHCLDYAFLKLCDENPSIEYKNYLQIKPDEIDILDFSLPDKYVVVTSGYTAAVREFPANHINGIVDYINSHGYRAVFLGQAQTKTGTMHVIEGKFDETINLSAGINLIDKTSLLQAAKIMGNAKAVVGVDNGLLHVAGCTDVPIVGGFTTVSPEYRMPVRDGILGQNYYPVVPDKDLGCRFCQVRTNFLYGHDYKNCLYKDNLCTKQMTAAKFIAELEKIL